jgi:hypothetical protein
MLWLVEGAKAAAEAAAKAAAEAAAKAAVAVGQDQGPMEKDQGPVEEDQGPAAARATKVGAAPVSHSLLSE